MPRREHPGGGNCTRESMVEVCHCPYNNIVHTENGDLAAVSSKGSTVATSCRFNYSTYWRETHPCFVTAAAL